MPFVVENPTVHIDIQQEVYTVPTKDTITHDHAVLHDKNFGVGSSGSGSSRSGSSGSGSSGSDNSGSGKKW